MCLQKGGVQIPSSLGCHMFPVSSHDAGLCWASTEQQCQIQPSWLKWMTLQLPCFTFFKEGAPRTIQESLYSHLVMTAMNLSVSTHVHCSFSFIRVAHTVYSSYGASHSEHLEFKDKLTVSSLYVSI